MELRECIATRRSVRKYLDKKVGWEDVTEIIEAGMQAPSAGNLQIWKFIVVLDQDIRSRIAQASFEQLWMAKAPVHIVVCADHERMSQFYGIRGDRLYLIQDCAAAVENMLLTAHSLGLGACWIGAFNEDLIDDIVGIPEKSRAQAIVTLGYADEKPEKPRKAALTHTIFLGKYGSRIKDMDAVMAMPSGKVMRGIEGGKNLLNKLGKHGAEISKNLKEKIKKSP